MRMISRYALCGVLCGWSCLAGQPQSSAPTQNEQDVPKQQSPGTNNPDLGKDHRQAPKQKEHGASDTNSADVPQQQPGTNNPDIAKQRQSDSSTNTDSSASGKKNGSRSKAKKHKSTGS